MKISGHMLRRIIKEAILLEYERYVYRDHNGELRMSDDEGNDEPAPNLERQYGHLRAGGPGETLGGGGRYNDHDHRLSRKGRL